MRRTLLIAVLAVGLVIALIGPSLAAAQARPPAQGPRPGPGAGPVHRPGGPTVVVRGGYYGPYYRGYGGWGYPYYSPFWGFYPWYPYWGAGWGWGGYPYWGWYDPTGSVRLQVTPKNAQVFVDGYFVGIVDDFDGTFQRLNVPPGGHELVLYLEGFRTVRQEFYAATGRDFKVTYAMVPLKPGEPQEPKPVPASPPPERGYEQGGVPPPRYGEPRPPAAPPAARPPVTDEERGFGTLAVRVQPSGAEVRVDGEQWRGPEGQERLLIQLVEGTHIVEITKAGYVTFSTEIQVRRGETAALNVSLPPREPR